MARGHVLYVKDKLSFSSQFVKWPCHIGLFVLIQQRADLGHVSVQETHQVICKGPDGQGFLLEFDW